MKQTMKMRKDYPVGSKSGFVKRSREVHMQFVLRHSLHNAKSMRNRRLTKEFAEQSFMAQFLDVSFFHKHTSACLPTHDRRLVENSHLA